MHCNGDLFTQAKDDSLLYCDVPVKETLLLAPFELEFDDLIVARVRAHNSRLWSDWSDGNTVGEKIKTEPRFMSAPQRDSATNTQKIVVNWEAIGSPEDGNSAVISYSLEYDAGSDGETWETLIGYLSNYMGLTMQVT